MQIECRGAGRGNGSQFVGHGSTSRGEWLWPLHNHRVFDADLGQPFSGRTDFEDLPQRRTSTSATQEKITAPISATIVPKATTGRPTGMDSRSSTAPAA